VTDTSHRRRGGVCVAGGSNGRTRTLSHGACRKGRGPWLTSPPLRAGAFIHAGLPKERTMNRIIYIVGLIVVVVAVLSFFGLG
jgi:hypothetical protein